MSNLESSQSPADNRLKCQFSGKQFQPSADVHSEAGGSSIDWLSLLSSIEFHVEKLETLWRRILFATPSVHHERK